MLFLQPTLSPALLVIFMLSSAGAQTLDFWIMIGGRGKTSLDFVVYGSTGGDCSLVPHVPFDPRGAVGLRDNMGRAMVCGGSKNNNGEKSCVVLDRPSNQWLPGPSMKRKRVGAHATCLDSGVCYVFGGKSKSTLEKFDPATNSFSIVSEPMPVNSTHGLCTALAPSGLIYMIARRQPGVTRAFTFDPNTEMFTELATLDVEKRYPACFMMPSADGQAEEFFVVGGGVNIYSGTSTTHVYNSGTTAWTDGVAYPHEVYGVVAMPALQINTHLLFGGVTPNGDEPTLMYTFDAGSRGYNPILDLVVGRTSYVGVPVLNDQDCPGAK